MKKLGVHREIKRPESKYDQVETPEVPQGAPIGKLVVFICGL